MCYLSSRSVPGAGLTRACSGYAVGHRLIVRFFESAACLSPALAGKTLQRSTALNFTLKFDMRETVRKVRSVNGLAAVEAVLGEYSIVDQLGGGLEANDEVDGNFESHGGAILVKVATGERLTVFGQNCHASPVRAGQLLGAR